VVARFGEQPADDKKRQADKEIKEIEQHSNSKLSAWT
jgi:hypothetical protein